MSGPDGIYHIKPKICHFLTKIDPSSFNEAFIFKVRHIFQALNDQLLVLWSKHWNFNTFENLWSYF